MEEKLRWLDEEYLSKYDRQPVDSRIPEQQCFAAPVEQEYEYSITEDEPEEDATYLSINTVVGDDLDAKLYVAFQILEYTLLDAPGAPLKQALIDAGIGKDILGGYESGILQPYFSVVAKDANKEQKEQFVKVVKDTLRDLAEHGINRKSLLAGINYYEFKYREADYGSAPKGLMYGLQCLDSWLYDGDPMTHLEYQDTFDYLKNAVHENYFEQLIRDYLLDNPFEAVVILSPKKNLTAIEEEQTAKKLAAYKETLDSDAIAQMVEDTKALKTFQDTPDTPEVLAKVPMLSLSDIDRQAERFYWTEKIEDGVKVLHHNYFTSGIGYVKVLFETDVIPQEDLPYVGLLKSVLGLLNTEHYSYADLTSEMLLNTGGIDFSVSSFANLEEPEHFTGALVVSARVLYDKMNFGFDMIREILLTSDFTDEKRLGEVIRETRSRAKMKLENSGHSTAVSRATSYFSPTAAYNELTGGTTYYRFLEQIAKNYETQKGEIIAKLQEVCKKLFAKANMLVNYTADEDGYACLPAALSHLTEALPEKGGEKQQFVHEVYNHNEGLKTSSQVNYVARCGNFRDQGLTYTGALKILQVILSYDYLWVNIRVKGGAYGCMSGFGRSGEGYVVSYRDPHMKETNDIFEGIVDYLKHFDIDDRDMTKYIIGTISNLDAPLTPSLKGGRGLSAYLSGITDESMQQERDEILNAKKEDIQALAAHVQAILDTGALCAVGAEDKVEANKEMFGEVAALARA
jgi:Zn-dependent M16 (insulinase) family peptidase